MFRSTRRPLIAVAVSSVLALGISAGPASAQHTSQSGLVNVSLTDTNVQLPVAIAANVCGVQANVIAAGNFGGNAVCDSATRSRANN